MFLQLIRIKYSGLLQSFKTLSEVERLLRCEFSEETGRKLLDCSLTDQLACVTIEDNVLTIINIQTLK